MALRQIHEGRFDMAISYADNPADVGSFNLTALTQPLIVEPTSVAVQKVSEGSRALRLFEPFTPSLWIAVACFTFVFAAVLHVLQLSARGGGGSSRQSSVRRMLNSIYHSWAFLLQGSTVVCRTPAQKLARIAMLFFALVLVATYTAQLAAVFTRPEFVLRGPTSWSEVFSAEVCVLSTANERAAKKVASKYFLPPPDVSFGGLDSMKYCSSAVSEGRASAILGSSYIINEYLFNNDGCSNLSHVRALDFAAIPGGFAYTKDNRLPEDFGAILDRAVLEYTLGKEFSEVLTRWFFAGRSCPGEELSQEAQLPQVSVEHMYGLFLLSGGMVVLALLIAGFTVVRPTAPAQHDDIGLHDLETASDMLRLLITKLDDISGAKRIPDTGSTDFETHDSLRTERRPSLVNCRTKHENVEYVSTELPAEHSSFQTSTHTDTSSV
ncbi:hypothetical protein AB1Y20_011965 [Prymnesium parvum]